MSAPFAADILSRIADGDLRRGHDSASEWLRRLDETSFQLLRDKIESTHRGDAAGDSELDVVAVTWLLRCLDDPALPLQPPTVMEEQSIAEVMAFVDRFGVLVSLEFWRRSGSMQFGRIRISDELLPQIRRRMP